MSNSVLGYFGYVVLALTTLVVTAGIHVLSWYDVGWHIKIFDGRSRDAWRHHRLPIVAVDWLIYVWAAVYAAQLPWLVHAVVLLLRRLPDIGYLFTRPCILPPTALLASMAGHGATLGWLSLWCSTEPGRLYRFAPLCLVAAAAFHHAALAVADNALRKHAALLCAFDARADACAMRVLAHNGMAAAGAWSTVVALYAVGALIEDAALLTSHNASYVTLALIAGYVVVFFTLDVGFSLAGARWLVTPYVMASIALLGAVLQSNDAWRAHRAAHARSLLMTSAVMLALACTATLIKLALAVGRRQTSSGGSSAHLQETRRDDAPQVEIAHL